jgi:hypothetical protein
MPGFFPDFIVYPQLEVWFYTYPLPSRGFTAPNITPLKPPSPKPIPPPNNRIKPTLHPQHQRPNPPLKHKRSCYPPPPVGDQEQPRPRRHSTRRVNRVPFPSNPRRQPERARVQEQVRRPGVELCSAAAEVPGAPVEEEAREGCGEGVEGGFWIVSFDRQGAGGGGGGMDGGYRRISDRWCRASAPASASVAWTWAWALVRSLLERTQGIRCLTRPWRTSPGG